MVHQNSLDLRAPGARLPSLAKNSITEENKECLWSDHMFVILVFGSGDNLHASRSILYFYSLSAWYILFIIKIFKKTVYFFNIGKWKLISRLFFMVHESTRASMETFIKKIQKFGYACVWPFLFWSIWKKKTKITKNYQFFTLVVKWWISMAHQIAWNSCSHSQKSFQRNFSNSNTLEIEISIWKDFVIFVTKKLVPKIIFIFATFGL